MNKNTETLSFAEEILKDIEYSKIPLKDICLKVMRLTQLLNDNDCLDKMSKVSSDIAELESNIEILKKSRVSLKTTYDKNRDEKKLQEYKTTIHSYVSNRYYELKLSTVPEGIFESAQSRVNKKLSEVAPKAIKQFVSVYDNLKSRSTEDWSNAVHSCRRILKTVADALYPPYPDGKTEVKRNEKSIKIGPDNYINRLMIYIEDHSTSEKSRDIIGSNLKYIGDRLDAIYNATTKGTHADITRRDEAERYIIYTYLLLGDILSL